MSPALPSHPNLDHLKKQAKDLLRSYRVGHPQVCPSLQKHLPRFSQKSTGEILAAGITLHDGVEVRVVELTGEPGDAVLLHPALFRGSSRNCADVPSFVRG